MYHLSLVLLLAVPLAHCRPADHHPVMVMMMVPEQHLYDANAVNGMMQSMNTATMEKVMTERREGMMQQNQQQEHQQQQEQQQQEMMEQVEMMRKMAESRVISKDMATQSNVAMLEEIMSKMAAMVERMRAMSSTNQVSTEQRVDSTNTKMTTAVTSGMEQQISGMVQEMTRMMQTSGGSAQQATGSDKVDAAVMKMTGGCENMGMFLPAGDNCHFHQCTFGAKIEAGAYSVVPMEMACAPGMAVAEGYAGGYDNPCTVESTTCMQDGGKAGTNSNQGVQRYAPRD